MTLLNHKAPKLICMDDVQEAEITWLWYPYIPKGASTLLFGPGGVGKSHILSDLAARISRGASFPFEVNPPKRMPGRVLMMSAEDEADKVLKPNLRLAGANMKNIFIPPEEFIMDETGIIDLEEFISTCQCVVCFLDPIVAYMGGKRDMFRSNEVREVMGPLNKIARKRDIALVIAGHERKNKEGSMQDLASGSADFVNAPRSALYAVEDKMGCAMWHAKANYGPKGPGLGFEFRDNVFEWTHPREEKAPVFGRGGGGGHNGASEGAEAWLVDLLKGGPVPAKTVEAAAKAAEINMRTLNRVKKDLGIDSSAKRIDGKIVWFWHTAGQEI